VIEIGVGTAEAQRGKGYATVTCARLILECERGGTQTFWNAAAQNTASVALARKLGYRTERPSRVYWWPKVEPGNQA
jgi:RimJ/RimL family protein N-acetyltransferase